MTRAATVTSELDWVRDQIEQAEPIDRADKWQRLRALFEKPVIPIQPHWGVLQAALSSSTDRESPAKEKSSQMRN